MITLTPGSHLPLAWRIGGRDLARDWRRGLLVGLLIVVPLALLMGVLVVSVSISPNLRDEARIKLGRANTAITATSCVQTTLYDVRLNCDSTQPTTSQVESAAQLLAFVPAGQHAVVENVMQATVIIDGAPTQTSLAVTSPADPLLRDRYELIRGNWPTATEIAVNEALAVQQHIGLGDTVTVGEHDLVVSGIIRFYPYTFAQPIPYAIIDHTSPAAAAMADQGVEGLTVYLAGGQPTLETVRQWNRDGVGAITRDGILGAGDPDAVAMSLGTGAIPMLVAGVGAVLVMSVLVSGAAMAMGAHRARRVLALLSATGARPRLLRSIFLFQGTLIGVVAASAAILLGIGGGFGFLRIADRLQWAQVFAQRVPWPWLGGAALIAVVAGAAAAAIPGFRIGAVDPARALRERHRPARLWLTVIGICLLTLSAGVTTGAVGWATQLQADKINSYQQLQIAGAVAGVAAVVAVAGVLLCVPLILRGVARLCAQAPLSARMAGRDLGRSLHRSVPITAAVLAGSIVAGMAVVTAGTIAHQAVVGHPWSARLGEVIVIDRGTETTSRPDLIRAITEVVPIKRSQELMMAAQSGVLSEGGTWEQRITIKREPCTPDSPEPACRRVYERMYGYPSIVIGDADLVPILAGIGATQEMRDQLARGGAIVFGDGWGITDGHISFEYLESRPNGPTEPTPQSLGSVDALVVQPSGRPGSDVLMSKETATRLGLISAERPAGWAWWAECERPPTPKEAAIIDASVAQFLRDPYVAVESGPQTNNPVPWIAAAVAGGVLLLVVVIITILASNDRRRDDALLASLGGGPSLRRRVAAAQAIWLGSLGTVCGVLIAACFTWANLRILTGGEAIIPIQIAFLTLGVPLSAGGIAWLTTSGRAGLKESLTASRPHAIGGD